MKNFKLESISSSESVSGSPQLSPRSTRKSTPLMQSDSHSYGAMAAHKAESKYFQTFQVDASVDFGLLMLKSTFFDEIEQLAPSTTSKAKSSNTSTPKSPEAALATALIKEIKTYITAKTLLEDQSTAFDVASKDSGNKKTDQKLNTIAREIISSKQFNIIYNSPYHLENLFSWLSEIQNPSNTTILDLLKRDAKTQAAIAIIKKEIHDLVSKHANMMGGNQILHNILIDVISNITKFIEAIKNSGNSERQTPTDLIQKMALNMTKPYDLTCINYKLQAIFENNYILLNTLKKWLQYAKSNAHYGQIKKSFDAGELNPTTHLAHPVTMGNQLTKTIQDQAKTQKTYEILKNKIFTLYHNPRYGKAIIETFFIISEIKDKGQREVVIYRLAHQITEIPKKDNMTTGAIQTFIEGVGKAKGHTNTISNKKPNEQIKGSITIIINELLYITSDQKNSLKNWVKTGLASYRPEQSTSIAKIGDFFSEYLLETITELYEYNPQKHDSLTVYFDNPIWGNLTRKEISALQTYKLGKSGYPDKNTELYDTVQKLIYFFEKLDHQNLMKRILNTIMCVIDSEQYFANTGNYGSGWVTDHRHIENMPDPRCIELGYDKEFYLYLTSNSDVMRSIYYICQQPEGFLDKDFASLWSNLPIGPNYRTDAVKKVQSNLPEMITKEFYGAGYHALKVVSAKPERIKESIPENQINHNEANKAAYKKIRIGSSSSSEESVNRSSLEEVST